MGHPVRIGQLLVQSGVLSEAALAEVLERQKADRRRLGDLLAERNLVEPRRLAQILSYQLSCPWLSLSNVDLARDLIALVPRDLAIKHTLVPVHLREKNGTTYLYVATHDPTDEPALAEVAEAVKMPVRPMVAITYEIRQALTRYYGAPIPSLTTAPVMAAADRDDAGRHAVAASRRRRCRRRPRRRRRRRPSRASRSVFPSFSS